MTDIGQQYEVRQATFADAAELARLRWELAEAPGETLDDFRDGFTRFLNEAFCRNNWNVWVADQDGSLIACLFVHQVRRVPKPGLTHGRWGFITDVFVASDFDTQGIASELLGAVVDWAREQGLESLRVWPADEGVSFPERLGFARSGEVLELALQGPSVVRFQ